MPPKRAAAKKAAKVIENVTDSLSKMSVGNPNAAPYKPWSMDFTFPYMIKTFLHDSRESCSIDFLIPTVYEERVHPRVVSGGTVLALTVAVPEFFPEEERVLVSAGNDNVNTNQATAHTTVVQDVRKAFNDVPEILVKPQLVQLPFTCEEQIVHWENQLFHGDAEVSGALNEQQFFCVLSVSLFSMKRPTGRRNRGSMRVVGSPALNDHRRQPAQQHGAPAPNEPDVNMGVNLN